MTDTETVVCRPTRWFIIRAVAMLLLFSVFAVLFYRDGSTGYRAKNEVYYTYGAFRAAVTAYTEQAAKGKPSAESWRTYAVAQTLPLPADASLLPAGMPMSQPWPPILQDAVKLDTLDINTLWREYTKGRGWDEKVPDEPYDSRKIREQWIVFWISSALALVALFYLVRTLRRSMSADATGVAAPGRNRIPYANLRVLDLRKWENKGLAFIDYDGPSGKGRLRIDGLTYGGFKAEDGEPAERLMQMVRKNFSGEIIEYTAAAAEPAGTPEESVAKNDDPS